MNKMKHLISTSVLLASAPLFASLVMLSSTSMAASTLISTSSSLTTYSNETIVDAITPMTRAEFNNEINELSVATEQDYSLTESTAAIDEVIQSPINDSVAANDLKLKLAAIIDMAANFKQQVIDDNGQVIQSSEGQMWVKKPQQFRWEVAEPYAQVIVADKSQVWLYDKDLEQAVVRKLDQQISNVPALLISGDVQDLSEHYSVTKSKDVHDKETFILKPDTQQGDALFVEMQASFVNNQLAVMRLVDNLGQFTHIAFSNIRNNKKISDDVFKLNLPDHVDIIFEEVNPIEDVDLTISN